MPTLSLVVDYTRHQTYSQETALKHDPWRLIVKLKSRRTLKEYAKFHNLSGRALARRAGLSPAIVNHLMSGERDTCNLDTARKLEEALQCPPGFLFEPTMSRVADSARHKAGAA